MSVNISALKNSILDLIKDNDYTVDDIKSFIEPVTEYINAPTFLDHIGTIVEEILKDRDGNNNFTIDDIKLLGDDILGITALINGLILVIGALPEIQLKYEKGATEELMFKVISFIFLVVIPKETGNPWNEDQKVKVVDLILAIYQSIISSQVTKDIVANISKWFKKKGYCKCICGEENKDEVFDEHIPQIKAEIHCAIQKDKDLMRLQNEINYIKKKMKSSEN